MDHRVKYMVDLIEDCKAAIAQHKDEQAFNHPEDRARVMSALIYIDGLNGLRKSLRED
jgi:hypothetical protein